MVSMSHKQEESTVNKEGWLNQIPGYGLGGSLECWDGVEGLRKARQKFSENFIL